MADSTTLVSGLEATYQPKREVPKKILGKDDFLQLMLVQMQNQDPMEPMDNTESIAQLANFSSLEQMTNINESMTKLLEAFNYNSRATSLSMIGKEVGGVRTTLDSAGEEIQEEFTGRVKGVDLSTDIPTVIVTTESGEIRVPQTQVTEVLQTDSASPLPDEAVTEDELLGVLGELYTQTQEENR